MGYFGALLFLFASVSAVANFKLSSAPIPGIGSDPSINEKSSMPSSKSFVFQTPLSYLRRGKEMKKMLEVEHDADENIRKFQQNLEALKTTVEFEPVAF